MTQEQPNTSKDEQVGFHKGAFSTLAKEREEMLRIVNICEQLMQMHLKALKDMGVDLVAQAQQETPADKKPEDYKPIEDLLNK
ncbi:hypothetical protein GOV04_04925 [Candidatus Woesearchaeota archaeon]|nr:hypothetical protein [Candidatus Woesearchaeota archaeon]